MVKYCEAVENQSTSEDHRLFVAHYSKLRDIDSSGPECYCLLIEVGITSGFLGKA